MSLKFLKEMIEILPMVSILSALITVWILREVIVKYLGNKAGVKGKIFSLLVGAFSAGPIYAAFPVCNSLLKKGASVSNPVIILSSWAVIKVPMFIVESKFPGLSFAVTRYLLTIPFIFLMGYILQKNVSSEYILHHNKQGWSEASSRYILMRAHASEDGITAVLEKLPGFNCKACGEDSCEDFSRTVTSGENTVDRCKFINKT